MKLKLIKKFEIIFFNNTKMATLDKTTHALGNTKTRALKNRNYILTVNEKSLEHYEDIKTYITGLKSNTYYLCCEHIGQENKHYHIYAQFKTPIALSLKKLFGAHVEASIGTPQDNIKYLRCQDDKHMSLNIKSVQIDEIGEFRNWGGLRNIKQIKEATNEQLEEELPLNYYNIAKKIKQEQEEEETFMNMLTEIENDELKGPQIIYITGDSGNGKTYGAYKLALKNYDKKDIGKMSINNNFIKIINENAKCFVIEEFRPSQIHASEFLQLTDKYGYNCNIKGGFKTIRPEMIIICSILKPTEIYKDEINKQFIRRITTYYKCVNRELIESKFEEVIENNDILID